MAFLSPLLPSLVRVGRAPSSSSLRRTTTTAAPTAASLSSRSLIPISSSLFSARFFSHGARLRQDDGKPIGSTTSGTPSEPTTPASSSEPSTRNQSSAADRAAAFLSPMKGMLEDIQLDSRSSSSSQRTSIFTSGNSANDAKTLLGGESASSPKPAFTLNLTSEDLAGAVSDAPINTTAITTHLSILRTNSSLGRSIAVSRSAGTVGGSSLSAATSAITNLNRLCSANAVAITQKMQRFHERPGLRRKKLKMVRWKRNFKDRFTSQVQRILYLKSKGW